MGAREVWILELGDFGMFDVESALLLGSEFWIMGLWNLVDSGFCGTLGCSGFCISERLIVWIMGLWDLSALGVFDF